MSKNYNKIYEKLEPSIKLKQHRENEVKLAFKDFIKKGDIVCDVGSHISELSFYLSELVGKKGTVYSFEANKFLYKILEKNLFKKNNIKIIKKAVSNKEGKTNCFW
jgi:tRNA A58 N-methylase Trm61